MCGRCEKKHPRNDRKQYQEKILPYIRKMFQVFAIERFDFFYHDKKLISYFYKVRRSGWRNAKLFQIRHCDVMRSHNPKY